MRLRNNILWIGCLTAAAQACALTLGTPHGPVVLGAPLDVRITVTPDPDQTLASSCIEAHALFGETPAKIRTDLQPPHTVRLRSLQAINEPLATLHLSAGCSGKVSRSYTLFADPPEITPAAPTLPTSASAPRPAAAAAADTASTTPPAPRRSPPKTATAKRPAAPKKPAPPPPAPPAAAPSTAAAASATAAPVDAATLQTAATNARPVLRMDTLFLFHDPAEATTIRPDTTIALAPTPAEAVASERLLELEKQLSSLQQQQKKDRAQILSLTSQLAVTAAADTIPLWLYLLLAALVASLLAIAYLLHRLRVERTLAQDGWMQAVRSAQTAPAASGPSAAPPAIAPVPEPESTPEPSPTPVTTTAKVAAPAKTVPPPVPPQETPEPAPLAKPNSFLLPQADNFLEDEQEGPPSAYFTVTSQDFLDTQEQAEFYASIGEYDEAIALLQTHIASDSNSSPLPYLKLLDFFYQLSRTDAFEQTRQDLEAAFNIDAPSLTQYHAQGPGLLEGYPTLLTHIEALWPSDEVLPLLRGAIHYPTKTPALPEPLPRLASTAFHELLLLYGIAQATPAATRGSLTGRTSTIAAAQGSAALGAPAAAALLDLPNFTAASMDAGLPELPALSELPALPQAQSPGLQPLAEEPAAAANDALLTDFGLDWPLPTDAAESAAPTPPAEETPALPFDLDGLDFDNFEFKPTAPPDTKA